MSIKEIFAKASAITRHKLKYGRAVYSPQGWLEYPAQCERCGEVLHFNSEINALYTAGGTLVGTVSFESSDIKIVKISLPNKTNIICKRLLIMT